VAPVAGSRARTAAAIERAGSSSASALDCASTSDASAPRSTVFAPGSALPTASSTARSAVRSKIGSFTGRNSCTVSGSEVPVTGRWRTTRRPSPTRDMTAYTFCAAGAGPARSRHSTAIQALIVAPPAFAAILARRARAGNHLHRRDAVCYHCLPRADLSSACGRETNTAKASGGAREPDTSFGRSGFSLAT